jgi:hypothetical protein
MNAVAKEVAETIKPKYDIFEVPLVKIKREGGFGTGPRGSMYPVEQLKVGQAFFVPANEENGILATDEETGEITGFYDEDGNVTAEGLLALNKRVVGSVSRLAKQHNVKLAVRTLKASTDPESNPWGAPGIGVWRLEGEYNYRSKDEDTAE